MDGRGNKPLHSTTRVVVVVGSQVRCGKLARLSSSVTPLAASGATRRSIHKYGQIKRIALEFVLQLANFRVCKLSKGKFVCSRIQNSTIKCSAVDVTSRSETLTLSEILKPDVGRWQTLEVRKYAGDSSSMIWLFFRLSNHVFLQCSLAYCTSRVHLFASVPSARTSYS